MSETITKVDRLQHFLQSLKELIGTFRTWSVESTTDITQPRAPTDDIIARDRLLGIGVETKPIFKRILSFISSLFKQPQWEDREEELHKSLKPLLEEIKK